MKKNLRLTLVALLLVVGLLVLGGCQTKEVEDEPVGTEVVEAPEKVDKQLVVNGQKVNVVGYVIDGQEYYNLKDLEHTLGYTMEYDGDKINIASEKDVNIYKFNPSDYKEYSLEIEYPDYKVDIEYDRKTSQIQAKYVNKKTGKNLKGEEAALIIENKLLTIDYGAGEDDIVNTILKNLTLDESYREFDLDIDFTDGKEFKIERENK